VREVAFTLYKIFIHEQRYDIPTTADRMGVSASLIYKWCENKSTPSVEQLRQLFLITEDREILDAILIGTGFIPVRRIAGKTVSPKDIREELLDNHDSLASIHHYLKQALSDGEVSQKEAEKLADLAEQNYREAADLLLVIRPVTTGEAKVNRK